MKKVLIGFGVLAVAAIAAAVFLFSNLNGIIQEAVQKIGSEATQATVTLDNVDISITSGRGLISGLFIGNPSGFKTPSAFEFGKISLKIDTSSIGQGVIIIKEIVIETPKITYELAGTDSNIDAILKNVEAYAKQFAPSGDASSGTSSSGGNSGTQTRLVINNLYIRGGSVGISADFLAGKALSMELPDIHLTDIGKQGGGASPAEVVQQIISAMTDGVGAAVGSMGLDKIMGDALGEATKVMDSLSGGTSGAASEATKVLEDVSGSLKSLFGD